MDQCAVYSFVRARLTEFVGQPQQHRRDSLRDGRRNLLSGIRASLNQQDTHVVEHTQRDLRILEQHLTKRHGVDAECARCRQRLGGFWVVGSAEKAEASEEIPGSEQVNDGVLSARCRLEDLCLAGGEHVEMLRRFLCRIDGVAFCPRQRDHPIVYPLELGLRQPREERNLRQNLHPQRRGAIVRLGAGTAERNPSAGQGHKLIVPLGSDEFFTHNARCSPTHRCRRWSCSRHRSPCVYCSARSRVAAARLRTSASWLCPPIKERCHTGVPGPDRQDSLNGLLSTESYPNVS